MKKLIVILAVLALAMPSMAAVTLTGTATGLTATIHYNYDGVGSRPRAFALRIAASAGHIDAVGKIKTADGISTATSPGYGIYPGSIDITADGTVVSYGSPVEPNSLPNAALTGLNEGAVVVALGSLYVGDANKPLNSADLVTVTCSQACTLTVTQEVTSRGGIVGENAATIAATPATLTITVPGSAPPAECVKGTAPFYADWVAFGKPSCWCYYRQCKGDADGLKQGTALSGYTYVYTNDLSVLIPAYNVKEAPKGSGVLSKPNGICADFAHDKQGTSLSGYTRVYTNDLSLLITNYNKKEVPKGSGVLPCDAANFNNQY